MILPVATTVLTLLLSASLSSGAAVAPRAAAARDFEIKQVRNPNYVRRSIPVEVSRLKTKYGASNRLRRRQQGTAQGDVVNTPAQGGSEYMIPVSIGTPPQVLNLDLDTGSSDLWVFSSATIKQDVKGQTVYNPGTSSTSKVLAGATWNITYGDGSASSGTVVTDLVVIGGIQAPNQAVEVANVVSAEFTSDQANDGLIGMAFSTLNTVLPTAQITWFDSVKSSLSNQLFTADLRQNQPGIYAFGYINASAYTGQIAYTPVNPITPPHSHALNLTENPGFWSFTASGFQVGAGAAISEPITGIADTGTTLLMLPMDLVQNYYASVKSAQYNTQYEIIVFNCADAPTLPSLSIMITSNGVATPITIPAAYMNQGPLDTTGTICVAGLQPSESIGINIFGDVFLKACYAVFDVANMQLGFANKPL